MRTAVAETSIHAHDAIKASGNSTHQCARILDHIRQHGDCSIGEIAHALGMEKSTLSARVYSLLYDSHNPPLEAKPTRKDRRSGVMVRPVGFPVAGQGGLF